MNKLFYFLTLFIISNPTFANDTIVVHQNHYAIDHLKKMIIVNKPINSIMQEFGNKKIAIHLLNDTIYSFQTPSVVLQIGTAYKVNGNDKSYSLYFSELPIVKLNVNDEIVDAPKVVGNFEISESNGSNISQMIGIEYRGGFSQTLDKKSYEIEFWQDPEGDESKDLSILGLIKTDSYNLQALYTEPSRINSVSLYNLWNQMDTLHYLSEEPQAINGVRMVYIDLFLNDSYKGLYAVGEKINRKQLRLKKFDNEIEGELYKGDHWGVTTFSSISVPYNNNSDYWDGFEYKHPKGEIDWSNLHSLISNVINLNQSDFNAMYKSDFDVLNLANYYIFLNFTRALDNRGKNIYLAKYKKGAPYFYVPWDLDGTLGYMWDTSQDNTFNDIMKNNLYERMLLDCTVANNTFPTIVKKRWTHLRQNALSASNIYSIIDMNYNYLTLNNVYEREMKAWEEYSFSPEIIQYIKTWINNRLIFLDTYFANLCEEIGVNENPIFDGISIYPNPFTSFVSINLPENHQFKNLSIYNIQGRKVLEKDLTDQTLFEIKIEEFPSSVYIFNINTENGDYQSYKMIKQ